MWAFLARAIEKVTFGAIKSGLDTVKTGTEIQKNRLEIKSKQQELEEKERLVRPATFEEVKEYDPKVRLIRRKAKFFRLHKGAALLIILITALTVFVPAWLDRLIKWVVHFFK